MWQLGENSKKKLKRSDSMQALSDSLLLRFFTNVTNFELLFLSSFLFVVVINKIIIKKIANVITFRRHAENFRKLWKTENLLYFKIVVCFTSFFKRFDLLLTHIDVKAFSGSVLALLKEMDFSTLQKNFFFGLL